MTLTGNSRQRFRSAIARSWLVVLALAALSAASADSLTGTFEVRNAAIEHNDQSYLLSAQIELPIDAAAREALRSGLPLNLELEIEVSRPRRFWPDATLATSTERYALTYHAVTDRYLVDKGSDKNAKGDQNTFADFDAALAALGKIDKLAIVGLPAVDDPRRYNVNVRVTVSIGDLPATLKLLMFWRDDWKRSTEWYTWPLSQ
jgi:hypothetical protein